MDNSTPKYASWIPTAGGYVANGQVVSTTPQYDEQGKFRVDVDRALFTQPQTQPQTTQVAAQPTSGITTANATGSNTDANATATGIGSFGSLSENTSTSQTGVLGTNAAQSPVAGNVTVNDMAEWEKDFAYAVATDNIQAQINLLVQRGNKTGEDFTTQINNLSRQRSDKITNISNDYMKKYNDALAKGDLAAANQILNEQKQWLDSVNNTTQLQTPEQQYEQKQQQLIQEWENNYRVGIDQIANTVLQLTGNLLNFQYDPYSDPALQIAQGYAVGRVKETMNATGMYYSSMTTSAITKAVAELVPVYEKMAKDEIRTSISLLQSTANFLMNLEQSEFNMWRSQIELQWAANAERRKEWQFAVDASNARGYVNNEEASILGVAPGSLSQSAREHMQELQEQLDEEYRSLIQSMVLADYKNDLEKDRMEKENELKKDYYDYTKQGSDGTGNTVTTIEYNPETGKYEVKQKTTLDRALTAEEIKTINAANEAADTSGTDYAGDMTGKQLADSLSTTNTLTNSDKVVTLEYIKNKAKSKSEAEIAVNNITEGSNKSEAFAKDILQQAGIDGLITYYKALDKNRFLQNVEGTDGTILDAYKAQFGDDKVNENNVGLISILASDAKNKDAMISNYIKAVVKPQIDATQLGSKASETKKNQKAIQDVLGDYAIPLLTPSLNKSLNTQPVTEMYEMLADKIIATPDYDVSAGWFNQGKKGMSMGIQNIIIDLRENYQLGKLGAGTAANKWGNVITSLQNYAKDKDSAGEIQGWDKASKNWDSTL